MYQRTDFLSRQAKELREEVFIREQGFEHEFDEIDEKAIHIVFFDKKIAYAVCRYYKDEEKNHHIGRVAISKQYRGKHLGSEILKTIEGMIRREGGTHIIISAQVRVKDFYEKNGYVTVGEPYFDEHTEHIQLEKRLF